MAHADIDNRRRRNLDRYHQRVAERRERGLCVKCGKRPLAHERSVYGSCGDKG